MKRAQKLAFALTPVLLLFGLGEVSVRVAGGEECASIIPAATGWDTMVGDPRYLWRLEPGRAFESPGGSSVTNAAGLRTRLEPDDPKGDDEVRILVTGDSSVYGWGQTDGLTYAEQLEAELNRNLRGRRFSVVNLGVPGYSTEQTARLLEDVGWRYQPDLLVVHNIFSDCNIDAFQDKAALALADPDSSPLGRVMHQSRLYCAAWMPWARYQANLNQENNRVLMPGMPTGPNAATTLEKIDQVIDLSRVPLRDYLSNLSAFKEDAESRGAKMLLAPLAQEWDVGVWTAPMASPADGQVLPWHPYREAQAAWAQANDVGRVDLPGAFAQSGGASPKGLFIDHMHPSHRGAQVMAWAVTDHIRQHPELVGLEPKDVLPLPARIALKTAPMHPGGPGGAGGHGPAKGSGHHKGPNSRRGGHAGPPPPDRRH
jgi:lysophospholipase L1-like esterase